jgi:transcription antitermination protein NusB
MSQRREVRERVLQALYAAELTDCGLEHAVKTVVRPALDKDEHAFNFAVSLLARTVEHRDAARELIEKHAENWHLSRIAVIDRLLLQMAITEILTFEDIPPKVSINEAIDIAKRYSTVRSGQFINGILDAVLESLMAEGRVHKEGRGLVGMDWQSAETVPVDAEPDA